MTRTVTHHYLDPLSAVWLAAAKRIGLRVERRREAFASTDGRGLLVLGTPETLDADDSVAQMIFHELCHALVEGPEAFARVDWGLDNETDRDVPREHATLRVQAALSGRLGLRSFFAATTDFRSFYDGLGEDPLCDGDPHEIAMAEVALGRVDVPPWAPHLRRALDATRVIVEAARAAGAGSLVDREGRPSLYEGVAQSSARKSTTLR